MVPTRLQYLDMIVVFKRNTICITLKPVPKYLINVKIPSGVPQTFKISSKIFLLYQKTYSWSVAGCRSWRMWELTVSSANGRTKEILTVYTYYDVIAFSSVLRQPAALIRSIGWAAHLPCYTKWCLILGRVRFLFIFHYTPLSTIHEYCMHVQNFFCVFMCAYGGGLPTKGWRNSQFLIFF